MKQRPSLKEVHCQETSWKEKYFHDITKNLVQEFNTASYVVTGRASLGNPAGKSVLQ